MQGTYGAGFALRVASTGGPWRWTTIPDGCTIATESYTFLPFKVEGAPSYGEAALSAMSIALPNGDDAIGTELRAHGLLKVAVKLWELRRSSPLDPLMPYLWFDGAIEQVSGAGEDWARIDCGPLWAPWAVMAPAMFSPTCRYTSTAQCPYVATCNKSYAIGTHNCTSNAKTDIFGGFRHLVVEGAQIEFRDAGVTITAGHPTARAL